MKRIPLLAGLLSSTAVFAAAADLAVVPATPRFQDSLRLVHAVIRVDPKLDAKITETTRRLIALDPSFPEARRALGAVERHVPPEFYSIVHHLVVREELLDNAGRVELIARTLDQALSRVEVQVEARLKTAEAHVASGEATPGELAQLKEQLSTLSNLQSPAFLRAVERVRDAECRLRSRTVESAIAGSGLASPARDCAGCPLVAPASVRRAGGPTVVIEDAALPPRVVEAIQEALSRREKELASLDPSIIVHFNHSPRAAHSALVVVEGIRPRARVFFLDEAEATLAERAPSRLRLSRLWDDAAASRQVDAALDLVKKLAPTIGLSLAPAASQTPEIQAPESAAPSAAPSPTARFPAAKAVLVLFFAAVLVLLAVVFLRP